MTKLNDVKRKLEINKLLRIGLTDTWVKINAKTLDTIELGFQKWLVKSEANQGEMDVSLTEFLLYEIKQIVNRISKLEQRAAEFNRHFLRAADNEECQEHILAFSLVLGANKKQLEGDKQAFNRWFDRDAILDRYQNVLATEQKNLSFCLQRAGWVYAETIAKSMEYKLFWQRHPLEETLKPLFVFSGDARVRISAFNCLTKVLQTLPKDQTLLLVGDSTLQYIYRASLERSQDVEIQKRAISLLGRISLDTFEKVLKNRLETISDGDDFFVRRHVVAMLGKFGSVMPKLITLVSLAKNDPSAAVRQVVAKNLHQFSKSQSIDILSQLLIKDEQQAVRAASALEISIFVQRTEYFSDINRLMLSALENEQDPFVLRVLLNVCVDSLVKLTGEHVEFWYQSLLPVIQHMQRHAKDNTTRQYAGESAEWFWLYRDSRLTNLYHDLTKALSNVGESGKVKLAKDFDCHDDNELARLLSLLAQGNFGLSLESTTFGRFVRKGDVFKFRFWRFIYELRHSSTDKRQAHRHTTGRHFFGRLRAPSNIMCELAETKVPGEPLLIDNELSGRPFLPLVDDMLSALDQAWSKKPYTLVTSDGLTEIFAPRNLLSRIRAQYKLTFGFANYARTRNQQAITEKDAKEYILSLKKLGFEIDFKPHSFNQSENSVTKECDQSKESNQQKESMQESNLWLQRFFPAILPFNLTQYNEQAKDYFFSVYENTLMHLGVFTLMVSGYFFGRHIVLNRKMRKARQAIPLVIGGWGTRGKSGTERLKAALFSGLGYSVVSKTSGCEAMFLHSQPFGTLREMFLFRPYDKATIWEQVNVVRLSADLECDVFLWECMGLTPSYVHVLQKDWMQDDIATITNTYPDHEDLQGPAGHEIPRVMTNFIPKSSKLITTEEQMLPILRDSAAQFSSKLISVGWLQAGLLTHDVLQRFPYEEHPYNIALVLALANEIDIDPDFAVKEMADRVVADLGVLKTYPISQVNGRFLQFVMGMSANEKFGCIGNWTRMEFDQHSLDKDPEVWVTTVINNRADRVPRSKVFAGIVAKDISADRHILIGDNLQGLMGFIREAWHENVTMLSLYGEHDTAIERKRSAKKRLTKSAIKLRIPISESQVRLRFEAMIDGLDLSHLELCGEVLKECWAEPNDLELKLNNETNNHNENTAKTDGLVACLKELHDRHSEYQDFLMQLEKSDDLEALQLAYQNLLWLWFEKKLVVVENYHASGNDIIHEIAQHTPPGLKARIMGMQNIKGTGLDYVYRWQAWESCNLACENMLSEDDDIAIAGVKSLAQFKEYGLLCEHKVRQTIKKVKDKNWTQNEAIQAELILITSNLDMALQAESKKRSDSDNKSSGGMGKKLAEYLEAFLDAGDAVKRRKRANQIYKDLANKRISHQRASVELQIINKRQKGGWAGEYMTQFRADNG